MGRFIAVVLSILMVVRIVSCDSDIPESSNTRAPAAPAPVPQVSMEGATCALAPAADANPWGRGYELRRCLRDLAYENWAQASAEAAHIAGWSLGSGPLSELTDVLVRYESGEAVGKDLEARGLLGGPGDEYLDDDTDENWQPITVEDWLRKSGSWHGFDAETGSFPNYHDYLAESLAALFGEPLSDATFIEIAPEDWKSEDPYQLRATLGERTWEREAANYGDWYDVDAVLTLLNDMAAELGVSKRAMPLRTYDQYVYVIVGPGEALAAAAGDGVIYPAAAQDGMDHGKAFEEEVRKQLGLEAAVVQ